MILIKDAADDNAYDYDTTSTLSVKRLESLRENFPEDYYPDTVIDMAQPDIGYHYLRRIANDDPTDDPNREVIITFKQPEPGPGGINTFYLYEKNPDGVWNPNPIRNISKDPSKVFVDDNIAPILLFERKYHLRIETNSLTGVTSDLGPEIDIIVDTGF